MSSLPVGSKYFRALRLYPNGECVVFRQKIKKAPSIERGELSEKALYAWACWQLYCENREALCAASFFMGLSLVRNFDKLTKTPCTNSPQNDYDREQDSLWWFGDGLEQVSPTPSLPRRNGLKGIPRRAARIVRNAAYLLQKEAGRQNLTFATVTVPSMPLEQMRILHENWNKAVELYRLGIARALKHKGLSGETVGVSEVQEERCDKTGLPILHLHTVFQGRKRFGHWAISTNQHDRIWRNAIEAVVPKAPVSFKSAANLQCVNSSACNYLGKYISKGAPCVQKVVDMGLAEWLPRQWWNCTRSLRHRVDVETIRADRFAEFCLESAKRDDKVCWEFHRNITIEIGEMQQYWVATCGRLTAEWRAVISAYSRGLKMKSSLTD